MSDPRYPEYVAAGARYRKAGDEQKWALGDLVVEFCKTFDVELKPGRPAAGATGPTLTGWARDIGDRTTRLSECGKTAEFYPDNVRGHEDYKDLSWSHFNKARQASGNDLGSAEELLSMAALHHMGPDDFAHYCAGDYWDGEIEWHELPERIRSFVPTGEKVYGKITKVRIEP